MSSASADTYSNIFSKNGVEDQHPLKTYDHPVYFEDMEPLYPFFVEEDGDGNESEISIYIRITVGCTTVVVVRVFLKSHVSLLKNSLF